MSEKAEQAVPFIIYTAKDGFKLNPEAEEFLLNLDPRRKVAVASIVGKYRTGKSFLVNRVLLNRSGKKAGFSVGPTINPCTKGLWLWRECLKNEDVEEDVDVILLDTEGFGGMDENTTHDSRIFLFSLLLSSFFIYNSQGNIDETALNNISLIINLAKDIRISDSTQEHDPADYFPSFLWIVRDFALQMVDKEGQKITSKDYLEKALENQKGVSDAIEQKNKIRRQLKHFFKDRDCSTLVRPVEAESDLQRLNEMTDNELRPEFLTQCQALRRKIFRKMKPKAMNGRQLNGIQLVEICKAYVQAINKGSLPNIENAWSYMCKNESRKAIEEVLFDMDSNLNGQLALPSSQPFTAAQLQELKQKAKEEVIKQFKKKSLGSEEELSEFIMQLDRQFEDRFKEFKKKNKEKQQLKFEEVYKEGFSQLEERLRNEEYSDFHEFERDFREFQDYFQKQVGRSDESSEFIKLISEKVYKQAGEKINSKVTREQQKQLRVLEQKVQISQNELDGQKQNWQKEKQQLLDKVSVLERERAQLIAADQFRQERLVKAEGDKEKLEKQLETLRENYSNMQREHSGLSQQQMQNLQKELEKTKNENMKIVSNLEKANALLGQENQFKTKENERLNSAAEKQGTQISRMQADQAQSGQIINQLKNQLNQVEVTKRGEVEQLKNEFSHKQEESNLQIDANKEVIRQLQEQIVQKGYLEKQVKFLQSQLEENKRLHDALLLALQQGMQKEDESANNELIETNKNLCSAMDKLEQRCAILDDKVNRLKEFKKMVQTSTAMQCSICSKFIATRIFSSHITSCSNEETSSANTSMARSQFLPGQSQSQSSFLSNQQGDQCPLQVYINQALIRDNGDNKPFTEYVLLVSFLNIPKWQISKLYKVTNFCELHHSLVALFPSMKFPESSLVIINAVTESGVSNSTRKRPAFIEERRKSLQQYMRDISKIEVIRNSRIFRQFLELDTRTQETKSNVQAWQNKENKFGVSSRSKSMTEQQQLLEFGSKQTLPSEQTSNSQQSGGKFIQEQISTSSSSPFQRGHGQSASFAGTYGQQDNRKQQPVQNQSKSPRTSGSQQTINSQKQQQPLSNSIQSMSIYSQKN